MGTQQTFFHSRDTSGMVAPDVSRQHITRYLFSQRDQSAFVILADDSIALPIPNACFLGNDVYISKTSKE
ncbi:MAG: hypothetical protein NTY92_02460 [Nitrosospira sp.]|nr:hypothetical protein [Nitrosospira sp.]